MERKQSPDSDGQPGSQISGVVCRRPDALHRLPNVDLVGQTPKDLLSLVEGYRDIFAAAAEWLKQQKSGE